MNTLSSREVAEMMEVSHKNLLRKIDNINETFENNLNCEKYWIESTFKNRGKQYRECQVTKEGVRMLYEFSRGGIRKKRLSELYQNMGGDFSDTVYMVDRFETTFFNKLKDFLEPLDIKIELQKNVLDYRLDGYIEEYNLAIEYDESQHFNKTSIKKDKKREREISKILNCKFIRLDYRNSDAFNLGVISKAIMDVLKGE